MYALSPQTSRSIPKQICAVKSFRGVEPVIGDNSNTETCEWSTREDARRYKNPALLLHPAHLKLCNDIG